MKLLRRTTVLTLLSALIVWPCVQMVLTKTIGLTPWKLAGFGMFATPNWSDKHIGIVAIVRGAEADASAIDLSGIELSWWKGRDDVDRVTRMTKGRNDLLVMGREGASHLRSAQLPAAFLAVANRARLFLNDGNVARVAAWVSTPYGAGTVFVVLSDRRIEVAPGRSFYYVHSTVHHFRDGRLVERFETGSHERDFDGLMRDLLARRRR